MIGELGKTQVKLPAVPLHLVLMMNRADVKVMNPFEDLSYNSASIMLSLECCDLADKSQKISRHMEFASTLC